jgi:hypothetical protein
MAQANRKFCKEHRIRLSGRPLGRPRKNPMEVAEQRELFREDQRKRNAIEGRFGTGKRKYNLDRIMAKLEQTARSAISMVFLVMNAVAEGFCAAVNILTLLRLILCSFSVSFCGSKGSSAALGRIMGCRKLLYILGRLLFRRLPIG